MSLFTSKGVSDPLVQASSSILNTKPQYSLGDSVVVKEGPNAGMNGTVVGSKSAGYTDIQLTRGRQITISDDSIAPPSGMLNEANGEEDDEKKPLDFKGKKKKKKSKKDLFKSDDDEDDDDDKDSDDDEDSNDKDGVPKNVKKKSKAGGKGEEIEINPKLGEQIQDLNRKANIVQSGRAMSIMRGFLSNK
jgi:hypothetical protein